MIYIRLLPTILLLSLLLAPNLTFQKEPKFKDFKITPFVEPWEVNPEREHLQLAEGWKFFKGEPEGKDVLELTDGKPVNPQNYVLRNGKTQEIGKSCAEPWSESCDDSSWLTVNVPFNFYELGKEMDAYRGTVWYRKEFEVKKAQLQQSALLHFLGSNYLTAAYLNGQKIDEHEGGYTSFYFDLAGKFKEGNNLLAVRVNNELGNDDMKIGDWWNYGGIHREVFVEFLHTRHVSYVSVKTMGWDKNLTSAKVNITIHLSEGVVNDGIRNERNYLLTHIYSLKEKGKQLIDDGKPSLPLPAQQRVVETVQVIPKPKLWSPEQPNLYFAKVYLFNEKGNVIDGFGTTFGIRKFEVLNGKLYLNHEPVFFRGINRHDEYPAGNFLDGGRVGTKEQKLNDFRLLKELGVNAMRTGHYPNHPHIYHLADYFGIMVIEEGGSTGSKGLNEPPLLVKWKKNMKEMMVRDKNHPSIVMWSIGNEYDSDENLEYTKQMAEHTRSLDDRPITYTDNHDVKKAYEYVDVISRNEYFGWYDMELIKTISEEQLKKYIRPKVRQHIKTYADRFPGKPIFIMEFGAEAVLGGHTPPDSPLVRGTEEYQAAVHSAQLEEILKHKEVVGTFPWLFADFKTRRTFGSCQFTPHYNQKGVVSFTREKKLSFANLQNWYKAVAMGEECLIANCQ